MKFQVRLSYEVEMFVEGKSEAEVYDWLLGTTPQEAKEMAKGPVDEHYEEEILCCVRDDADVDYVVGG